MLVYLPYFFFFNNYCAVDDDVDSVVEWHEYEAIINYVDNYVSSL